ncbi:glyoxalase [Salinigranum rubrum]|uniref:Glyoxalase n=1 Tax=Salinigranum rubrum TaxID=755307 RepID=A0A2I8VNU5_9EURY|nr:VOC family protein [Salinigranum rubrum]AUV83586.1 glyoxalase [Salinigranum rubrum]
MGDTDTPYPRSLAHVAVTVPDVEEALDWYRDVFGWTLLTEPRAVTGNDGYGGRRAVDVLGEFSEMTVAHLVTGNGIGVELFEFASTGESNRSDITQPGFFHICVVDPDVEGLAERIDERGGEHYSRIWRLFEEDEEHLLTYCTDPYGNLVEIYSHSHEGMLLAEPCPTDDS